MDQMTVTAYVTALGILARWTAGQATDWQAQLAITGLKQAKFIKADAVVTKENWPFKVKKLNSDTYWAKDQYNKWSELATAVGSSAAIAFYTFVEQPEYPQLAAALDDATKAIAIAQSGQAQSGNGQGGIVPPPKKGSGAAIVVGIGLLAAVGFLLMKKK